MTKELNVRKRPLKIKKSGRRNRGRNKRKKNETV